MWHAQIRNITRCRGAHLLSPVALQSSIEDVEKDANFPRFRHGLNNLSTSSHTQRERADVPCLLTARISRPK